ncbi:MAG: ATP-dependent helicase UvrD/PcrA, partial [Patescibacteria group bacterium]|nr:ATP-dependent helicase UvrD/PcrA [Patescibacteria group bacterium]
ELVTTASSYDHFLPEEGIEKFLENVSLASDQDDLKEEKEAVRFMTVHASKGLEFDYCFITGLEEDLFPHTGLSDSPKNIEGKEEERRLFYVALTRARKKVYLTYTQMRTIFGSRKSNIPSEFVLDIDDEFIERENGSSNTGREKIVYLEF